MTHQQYVGAAVMIALLVATAWFLFTIIKALWVNHTTEPVLYHEMVLNIDFTDSHNLSFTVKSPYEAQQLLNRFTWAGVREAMIVVNGKIEFEVDDTGLIIYRA